MSRTTRRIIAHVLLAPLGGFAILGMQAVFLKPCTDVRSPFTVSMAMAVGVFSQLAAAWIVRHYDAERVESRPA
jgi:hypothetical protein